MQTYSIKVALRNISPMIWRRFEINGNSTIADLHHIIQIAMGWDDEHLHQFRIYAKDYGIWYDGGPSFMDNAHLVQITQFEFDVGDNLLTFLIFIPHFFMLSYLDPVKKLCHA